MQRDARAVARICCAPSNEAADGEKDCEAEGRQQGILLFSEAEVNVHVQSRGHFSGRNLETYDVEHKRTRPLLVNIRQQQHRHLFTKPMARGLDLLAVRRRHYPH